MKYSFAQILCLCASSAQYFNPFQKPLHSADASETYSSGGPFTESFDKRVQTLLDHFHVPSISISVIDGNDTFAKAYGYAVLPDVKATTETLYYCASTTKSFTAASVLKLIEGSANQSEPLTLKTKIQSLIRDEFVLMDEYATSHVTFEDALSHRTGMPRHDYSYGMPNATLENLVRSMRHLPMTGELREKFQYCNIMFGMVSYVIETITGVWLGDFFRQHIWGPLGMHSTFFSLDDAKHSEKNGGPNLSVGYTWVKELGTYVKEPYLVNPIISGAGQTISNVLDYAKYLRAMLTMNETLLSEQSFINLRSPRSFSDPEYHLQNRIWTGPQMYGLGWQIAVYHGHEIFNHGGALPGFGVEMAYIPSLKNGVGFTFMGNSDGGSNLVALVLMSYLVDEMIRVPEDERINLVAMFDALSEEAENELQPGKARKRIYPDAPPANSTLPLPLPLEDYTGEYRNDGYGNLTIHIEDANSTQMSWMMAEKVLRIDVSDKLWEHSITFEHVSGNYFLAWGKVTTTGSTVAAAPAEFEIGVDEKVKRLGLGYEPSMGKDLIWFEKFNRTAG